MLELDMGNIREGKTMRAAGAGYELHCENIRLNEIVPFYKWMPIYANFNLKYEEVQQVDATDLLNLDIKSGLMLMDEAYTWLESRVSASKMNRYVSYFLFQSGKLGVDLVATVQLGSTIDLRFFDLCHVQTLARKNVDEQRFDYVAGYRAGWDVVVKNEFISFEDASKFWNDYDTLETVKPLGLEDLQAEMDKMNVDKINKKVDLISAMFLVDGSAKDWFHWRSAGDVFRYQVEDLLLRWGKPLVLAPLVTNRLKTLLRAEA